MKSHFIDRSEGVQTHYLEWEPKVPTNKLPVIGIHGNLSNARWFKWIGEELSSGKNGRPRQVAAIDLRGRGDSGLPDEGFSLTHMATDIEAVMDDLGLQSAHFIAYSMGVPYTLQFALRNPGRIQGLVIGDYPPLYEKLSAEWVGRVEDSYGEYSSWDDLYEVQGQSMFASREEFEARKDLYFAEKDGVFRKRFAKELAERLHRESEDAELSQALNSIAGSLLILKGDEKGSLLSDEELKVYDRCGPSIARVRHAGHNVLDPTEQVRDALVNFFAHLQ